MFCTRSKLTSVLSFQRQVSSCCGASQRSRCRRSRNAAKVSQLTAATTLVYGASLANEPVLIPEQQRCGCNCPQSSFLVNHRLVSFVPSPLPQTGAECGVRGTSCKRTSMRVSCQAARGSARSTAAG